MYLYVYYIHSYSYGNWLLLGHAHAQAHIFFLVKLFCFVFRRACVMCVCVRALYMLVRVMFDSLYVDRINAFGFCVGKKEMTSNRANYMFWFRSLMRKEEK